MNTETTGYAGTGKSAGYVPTITTETTEVGGDKRGVYLYAFIERVDGSFVKYKTKTKRDLNTYLKTFGGYKTVTVIRGKELFAQEEKTIKFI